MSVKNVLKVLKFSLKNILFFIVITYMESFLYLSRILLSKLASFKYIRAQLSSTSLFSYSSQGYTQSVGAVIGYYKSRFISKIVDIRWFKISFFTRPGESNGSMVSVSAPISTSLPSRKP